MKHMVKPDWAKWSAAYHARHPGRRLIQVARSRAKRKSIPFELSIKEIDIPKVCPILGMPLQLSQGNGSGGRMNSPSLDRIDTTKGYIDGNIQVISHQANSMKFNATREQLLKFADWIKATYE